MIDCLATLIEDDGVARELATAVVRQALTDARSGRSCRLVHSVRRVEFTRGMNTCEPDAHSCQGDALAFLRSEWCHDLLTLLNTDADETQRRLLGLFSAREAREVHAHG